ncbi:beta-lactamase family protein [Cutibacterium sp. WCA-380-WT-3A]|uniref:Beta-lactamase family protein n=1 Tax=Cutibacterium porci TaxID=2605781 RepID=A0A7K0J973_9ACTN|nr:serine hydrolase domain-containing protein [Cutibacterium porci]MSS46509.1 beta-lactamase family protein [Cutibacterium porci]
MTDSVLDLTADSLEQAHPHRLIVCQHGQVVGRRRWAPWNATVPSLVYSCSKTFTSAAVGIAVDRGAFGYDDTLAELWPEVCTDRTGPIAKTITVRNALSMASGHSPTQLTEPPLGMMRIPDMDTARMWLATEPVGRPGVDFAYNNLGTWMLSRIVRKHTGVDVDTIVTREVLEPLGCGPHSWSRDADGIPLGYSGMYIDAEDLARFGQLLLDDGIHEGTRLLPGEWITQHRTCHVHTDGATGPQWGLGYGWQTWMSSHGYRLDGAFGQFVLIVPEVDAVIVMTNDVDEAGGDKEAVLKAIWSHLLPALAAELHPEPEEVVHTVPTAAGQFDPTRPVQGIVENGSHIIVAPRSDKQGWNLSWYWPASPDPDDPAAHQDLTLNVTIGHSEWQISHCPVGNGYLDIAASGGWHDDTFVARLCVICTPHALTLRMTPHETTVQWDAQPLDPRGLMGLVRPEPRR